MFEVPDTRHTFIATKEPFRGEMLLFISLPVQLNERAKSTLLITCQCTGTRRLRLCTFWQTAPSHGRLLPGGAPWHSRAISAGGGRPGRFCTRLLPGKRSPTCCPELRNYTKRSIHFDRLCFLRFVKRKEKDIGRLNFFPMLTFDVRIDSMQG